MLQQKLQEEIELHTSLEDAIQKKDLRLANFSCLPHHVCCLLLRYLWSIQLVIFMLQNILHFDIYASKSEKPQYPILHDEKYGEKIG